MQTTSGRSCSIMPKPLNVNWDLAKGLYFQGLNMAEVSRRTGISYDALRQRAKRYRWTATVTALSQDVTVQCNKTLAERGKAWTHRLANLVERRMDYLETLKPADLKLRDLDELTRITDLTDRTARRTFGLDAPATTSTHLLVDLHSGLRHIDPATLPPGTEIIDIETESSSKPNP